IGFQIMESVILHQALSKKDARDKAIEMLGAVGLPSPEQHINEYPHQFSGGMRQRAMIAMALSCRPSLLIADEPTTALDATIQAQVLKLINDLRKQYQASILFITHDLGVIAHMASEVIIMYLGKIVEKATVREIFHNPKHPYTMGLLSSIPSLASKKRERLVPIKGIVPSPFDVPSGCRFAPRCSHAMPVCREQVPVLKEVSPGHPAACFLYSG
ncbi:MAG TPA: ABC transporter ATP-binding protein, partial [Spirochaetia bacterium]|nr:ABC transporter ATP-binding protein [Spirochaetia bacterium]